MTERELLERCRKGDRGARRELFDLTSHRVYRLLLQMTNNSADAADLTQETYLKAYTQIDQFDGRSSVATWLYRIAVNEALQFIRRNKMIRANLAKFTLQQPSEYRDEDVGRQLDVRSALDSMSPADRAILLLRYQERLNYRTIAEVIGCAEGTVASRLNRARDRLREILTKSYGGRDEIGPQVHPKTGP